jgi:glycosyltransferase involved in cell wall biosynthesis/SAM-dependent methyltransferase
VYFGDLRRTRPIARNFGFDRGEPVDRRYIEAFLDRHQLGIRGRVLEVGDNAYTRRFGGTRVTSSDVLHVTPGAPGATIIADLTDAPQIPSNSFDCVICTQTLQLIYDLPRAAATLHRILKPGGIALVTAPGISQIDDRAWASSWCWSLTPAAMRRLLAGAFGETQVEVDSDGNVLAAVAFLHGLAADELDDEELIASDPAYPLVVTGKAIKPPDASHGTGLTVSVVIPCFNQAGFLAEAIESALGQTPAPLDVILVDDGSTDNTSEVAARYSGVRVTRTAHLGLPAARNTGLAEARGDCIVFLDADDRLAPRALEIGLSYLSSRPDCAYVSGHHRLIDIEGAVLQEWPRPSIARDRYALLLQGNYISMGAAVLYRRDALDLAGGFDPALRASEDYDLYLRLARRLAVCDHDEVVAEYRRHGAAMTDEPVRMLQTALEVLDRQRAYTAGQPMLECARRAGIRHWRQYYGRRAADLIADRIAIGQRRLRGLRDAWTLARHAPAEAAGLLRRAVRGAA